MLSQSSLTFTARLASNELQRLIKSCIVLPSWNCVSNSLEVTNWYGE